MRSTRSPLFHALCIGIASAVVWLGCADEAPSLSVNQGCSLSSECSSPLVCAFAKCHQACKSSRDCAKGERCVQSDRPYYVCQKQGCSRNTDCVGKQVCAIDAQCRDQCLTQKDCLADQVCTAGVCADTSDLVGGALPNAAADGGTGAGQRCTLPTDCPGDLVCLRAGVCGPECIVDKDCPKTYSCKPLTPGGPGRCFPPGTVSDAGPASPLVTLVAGGGHTCARFAQGQVTCWGKNEEGQLGLGDTNTRGDAPGEMAAALPYLQLGVGRTVREIAPAGFSSCAILDNGRVKCWGVNDLGQLGLGDKTNRGTTAGGMGDALPYVDLGTGRTVQSMSGGIYHACAVLDNGGVKCWGRNAEGQLGVGDTNARGDDPGEMGDALPYVNLGAGRTAKAVSTGFMHTCALLDNAKVKCWGRNDMGELGVGDMQPRGTSAMQMGDALPYVDLGAGRTVKSLDASKGDHNCAILDNDRVKCWGLNRSGQLGLGDDVNRGTSAGQMGDALPYVDLGTGRTVLAALGGGDYSCAVLDDRKVKCWGTNENGELGRGDNVDVGKLPGEMGDALPYIDLGAGRTVKALSLGGFHSCAILDNDRFKCWGGGMYGQLGLGDAKNRGDVPGQMGDALPYVDVLRP